MIIEKLNKEFYEIKIHTEEKIYFNEIVLSFYYQNYKGIIFLLEQSGSRKIKRLQIV